MFAQFRSRYPAGSLVSELLQIHDGQYVVRALVQMGGTTLATGMAAANRIEQAEDQARLRALTVLGIESLYETEAHLQSAQLPGPGLPSPSTLPPSKVEALTANWELPEAVTPSEFNLYSQNYSVSSYGPEDEPELLPPPTNSATRKKPDGARARPSAGNSRPANPLPPEPVDLSDIIAQTSVELKRLNWSEVQGRTYLQRTYGKRSRQQLTDDELLDFLHFLQAEPSPGEPSF